MNHAYELSLVDFRDDPVPRGKSKCSVARLGVVEGSLSQVLKCIPGRKTVKLSTCLNIPGCGHEAGAMFVTVARHSGDRSYNLYLQLKGAL